MAELPPDQRRRLAKLCGMLGSSNPNEQVAAADLATKLIREHGLTWELVIMGAGSSEPIDIRRRTEPHTPPPRRRPQPDVRDMVQTCQAWSATLDGWSVAFLEGIARQKSPLSDKQLACLHRIYSTVLANEKSYRHAGTG